MPKYVLNTDQNGIEIYFDNKPDAKTLAVLKENGWRWNKSKLCWYKTYSTQAETIAKDICGQVCDNNSVCFEQKSLNFKTTICINKTADKYSYSSTNNQIICVDCNRLISIHSQACIFCGCPMSYTIETYFKKHILIKTEEHIRQAKERERQKQKEEMEYKDKAIKIFTEKYSIMLSYKNIETLKSLPIDKFYCVEENALNIYNNRKRLPYLDGDTWLSIVCLDKYKFQIKIAELKQIHLKQVERINEQRKQEQEKIRERRKKEQEEREKYVNFCKENDIPDKTIQILLQRKVSLEELSKRLYIIDDYKRAYPQLGLGHGGHVLLTEEEFYNYIRQMKK